MSFTFVMHHTKLIINELAQRHGNESVACLTHQEARSYTTYWLNIYRVLSVILDTLVGTKMSEIQTISNESIGPIGSIDHYEKFAIT